MDGGDRIQNRGWVLKRRTPMSKDCIDLMDIQHEKLRGYYLSLMCYEGAGSERSRG